MTLAQYLRKRSKEICRDNECTAEDHKCESYAYFATDDGGRLQLLDICYPDYFQGYSRPYAAIPLPWTGSQKDLENQVADEIAEQEATS